MASKLFAVFLVVIAPGFISADDEPKKSKIEWTNDPAKMTFPDAEVTGNVLRKEFKPTFIVYRSFIRQLAISQSSGGVHPEVEVQVMLPLQQKDKLDRRKFVLSPKTKGGKQPIASMVTSPDGKKLPQEVKMTAGQIAMKLEFGEEKDGQVSGKIYLCLSDKDKSYLAGTFQAKIAK